MKCRKLLIFAVLFIIVASGCSKDKLNKANVDEEIFEEGKQIVKLYAQAHNGEDKWREASGASQAFLEKYREDAESKLEVNDLFFVHAIELLNIQYMSYEIQKDIDELTGGSVSGRKKEEIKKSLLQFKDEYGI